LTLDIGEGRMQVLYPRVLTVTITNGSGRRLEWLANGCEANASIAATMTATWRDSTAAPSVDLDSYRDRLRGKVSDGPIRLAIQRPYTLLRRDSTCTDFTESRRRRLEPGESVTREYIWAGDTVGRLGPPPDDVPVKIVARLERWRFVGGKDREPIEVSLDSWVIGGHADGFLSPFQAIDVALADERLASWLVARGRSRTDAPMVEFDRDLGVWVVGVRFADEVDSQPVLHAAFIDPMTREVFAVKEHRVSF
jgi:hypothetical protein